MLPFRLIGFVALAYFLAITPGQAPAQSAAEKTDQTACKIEDWRWTYSDMLKALTVEGAVTCNAGHLIMRVYAEKEEKAVYLGNANSFINGYAFTAVVTDVEDQPESVSIKYTVSVER